MIFNIDDIIPFCRRDEHLTHTIRQIIRYDSGYLKSLFENDERLVFSLECYDELKRLTKGHWDNWETPSNETNTVFDRLKSYKTPYLYDFNNPDIEKINLNRLKSNDNE